MNHPKVEFRINEWQDLALKYSTGKLCQNSKQPSKMFTTVDGRVFFLSLADADKLENLSLKPGDLFSCGYSERHYNGSKWKEFECSKIGEPEVIAPRIPARSEGPAAAITPAPACAPATANGHQNTSIPNPTKPAAPAPVATMPRTRTILEDCLISAVAAAKAAEEWGSVSGYTIRFTSEDIRAMAITTCIARREERHAA